MNSVGKRYAGKILVPTARRPYSRIHEPSAVGICFDRAGVLHRAIPFLRARRCTRPCEACQPSVVGRCCYL